LKKVILVYDINTEDKTGQKRLNKVRKITKKYLHHIQKSVFEGELTESGIEKLKYEVISIVDKSKDFVIIYTFPPSVNIDRIFLTDTPDPTSNIF